MLDPDRPTAGGLVRQHRERLGLSANGLASRTTTLASDYIHRTEAGQRISRRSVAIALTRALELDPWQTDEFLYIAGHAPLLDWQQVTRELLQEFGHGGSFTDLTAPYYLRPQGFTTPEDETDATPGGATPAQ